jgi:hypothetical protein
MTCGDFCTYRSAGQLNPLIAGNVFPTAQRSAARTVRTRHFNFPVPQERPNFEAVLKTYE